MGIFPGHGHGLEQDRRMGDGGMADEMADQVSVKLMSRTNVFSLPPN